MRTPNYTRQFARDLRLAQRRGKDIEKLKQVVTVLIPTPGHTTRRPSQHEMLLFPPKCDTMTP